MFRSFVLFALAAAGSILVLVYSQTVERQYLKRTDCQLNEIQLLAQVNDVTHVNRALLSNASGYFQSKLNIWTLEDGTSDAVVLSYTLFAVNIWLRNFERKMLLENDRESTINFFEFLERISEQHSFEIYDDLEGSLPLSDIASYDSDHYVNLILKMNECEEIEQETSPIWILLVAAVLLVSAAVFPVLVPFRYSAG